MPDKPIMNGVLRPRSLTKEYPQYNQQISREFDMSEYVSDATSAAWDKDVLGDSGLVMVDFWAVWCGPCRMIAPTVEELAKEYAGKITVMKLNTDENPDIASRYKIMGIPTIMFFKNGQEADRIVGAVPKPQLKAKIDSLIG
jgi:thioredoxin 1